MTWDVYGKLRSVTGGAADVSYTYDAQGNRLAKIGTGTEPTDIYIRDASGNVLALYSHTEGAMDTVRETLKELYLYGSSRLAIVRPDRTIYSTVPGETEAGVSLSSYRREKYFEASNHLGNVLTTTSDLKLGIDPGADDVVDYYTADIVSAADYYPFGLKMDARSMSSENYRFGFNGKEQDDAISSLTHYDYGFRIYNPGIGRWCTADPKRSKYPSLTPYLFSGDNPISAIDPDGRDIIIVGSREYKKAVLDMLWGLAETPYGFEQLTNVLQSDNILIIRHIDGANEVNFAGSIANSANFLFELDLDVRSFKETNKNLGGDEITGMAHELQHFIVQLEGLKTFNDIPYSNVVYKDEFGETVFTSTFESDEIDATFSENVIRATLGYDLRITYEGIEVFGKRLSTTKPAIPFISNGLTSESLFFQLEDIPDFEFNPDQFKGQFVKHPTYMRTMFSILEQSVRLLVPGDFQTISEEGRVHPGAVRLTLPDDEFKD